MAPASSTLTSLAKHDKIESRFKLDEDERPRVAYNHFSDEIPVISLEGIEEDSPGGPREAIRKKIEEACEEWGMFQVVDHGFDPKLVHDMATLSRDFFALPDHEKLRYDMKDFSQGDFFVSSHLKDETVANWREMMGFIPYPIKDRDYTMWPNKPKEWRAVTEVYSEKMMGLATILLELLSEAMGLDKDAILRACKQVAQRMSVNFYPNCPEPNLAIGLIRHKDPSTITILQQDQVGGLQVTKDDGNSWITVHPIEDAFVVNLGNHAYLQLIIRPFPYSCANKIQAYEERNGFDCTINKYLSNGRFKSADHTAVVNYEHSRLSIATFINADKEAMVYPLKIQGGQKSVLQEPITFADMYKIHFAKQVEEGKARKLAKEIQLSKQNHL